MKIVISKAELLEAVKLVKAPGILASIAINIVDGIAYRNIVEKMMADAEQERLKNGVPFFVTATDDEVTIEIGEELMLDMVKVFGNIVVGLISMFGNMKTNMEDMTAKYKDRAETSKELEELRKMKASVSLVLDGDANLFKEFTEFKKSQSK